MNKQVFLVAMISITCLYSVQAGVLSNTLHESDAQEVYDGLVCPMWEPDVGIFCISELTMYVTIFDDSFESVDYNLIHVLSSIASVGSVSRTTNWHSDILLIGFRNHAITYSTEQCRNICTLLEAEDGSGARTIMLNEYSELEWSEYVSLLNHIESM